MSDEHYTFTCDECKSAPSKYAIYNLESDKYGTYCSWCFGEAAEQIGDEMKLAKSYKRGMN